MNYIPYIIFFRSKLVICLINLHLLQTRLDIRLGMGLKLELELGLKLVLDLESELGIELELGLELG